jgi:hypothetical protein
VTEYVIRFFIGGFAVSTFALLADVFSPQSFAGLFSAAPSVALATLAVAFWKDGPSYAALEGRSMMMGSLALCLYSIAVCQPNEALRIFRVGSDRGVADRLDVRRARWKMVPPRVAA